MKLTVTVSLLFFVSLCFCYEVYLGVEKHGLPKEKIVITDKEIQKFGILSFAELLKVFNVNIYTRSDAQQDISLSGGSFQQIKVLLNGVPINDPQTGHHNFNLPVNLDDIEYIEIIQNDNLTKYGNSAFSGVISIVTKKSKPNFIKASYGSFNTINTSVNLQSQHNSLRFSFGKSDGYRHNTDFLSYNVLYDGRFNNTDVTFGVLDRRFGAQDFYVLGRKEYEQIRTILCSVSPKINFKNNILLKTHLFFRTGYDFYTTQRTTPTVYSNYHNSYLYGINSSVDLTFKNFSLQPTVEVLFKNLDSKGFSSIFAWRGLGEFYDYEIKTGLSCLFTYKKFSFDTSLVGNYYSRYGFIPQIGTKVSCDIFDFLRIFAIVANIHRTPSYTELYYWDPAHQADDKLKVEKTTLYRSGFSAKFLEMLNFSISGFTYDASDFID
ncbi:MAG: TonB-dependent receptor plug domain-containing protein, partial [Endomicrobia bacterium]|nr:TonB-dependent receptor plug domain-containing protein [Endomicrobiia bacterium]